MKVFRSARVRSIAAGLAFLTLVLQAFVAGHHHGAMAASGADNLRLLASLSDLGLTLSDLPCHAGNPAGDVDGGAGTTPSGGAKSSCPLCAMHGGTMAAIVPAISLYVPVRLALAVPRPGHASVIPRRANALAHARGPPAHA